MGILHEKSCYWLSVRCDCGAYYMAQAETRKECLHELSVLGWLIHDEGVLCRACREREGA